MKISLLSSTALRAIVFFFVSIGTGRLFVVADTILEIAEATSDFDTLVTAIETAGLEFVFDLPWFCSRRFASFFTACQETKTVFAPKNSAFHILAAGVLDKLLTEEFRPHLRNLLLYHAIPGTVNAADVPGIAPADVETLSGEYILVTAGPVAVNGIDVEGPLDVDA